MAFVIAPPSLAIVPVMDLYFGRAPPFITRVELILDDVLHKNQRGQNLPRGRVGISRRVEFAAALVFCPIWRKPRVTETMDHMAYAYDTLGGV